MSPWLKFHRAAVRAKGDGEMRKAEISFLQVGRKNSHNMSTSCPKAEKG